MLISQTAEYAIRVMSCLAVRPDGEVARSAALSAETNIPAHYLSKVLRKLVAAKILSAAKGHGGGFALAKASNKIRIIDIIEAVEPPLPAKHCIFGWRICNSKEPCILHHRWSTVNEAFQTWVRTTTISEIRQDAIGAGWLVKSLANPPSVPVRDRNARATKAPRSRDARKGKKGPRRR